MRVIPTHAVRYTVFGELNKSEGKLNNPYVSGAIAGLASSLVSYPLEVVRTRLSVGESFRASFTRGSLFAGCSITVIETIPYAALSLGTYTWLKESAGFSPILSGLLSGALATSVCFPLDTVRRNKIVQPTVPVKQIIHNLWTEGRTGRFYRGLSIGLLKSAPTFGITMVLNDAFLKWFRAE